MPKKKKKKLLPQQPSLQTPRTHSSRLVCFTPSWKNVKLINVSRTAQNKEGGNKNKTMDYDE